jgi:hypothetical protein
VSVEQVVTVEAVGVDVGGDAQGVQVGVVLEQQLAADAVAAQVGPDGKVGQVVVRPPRMARLQQPLEGLLAVQHRPHPVGRRSA